MLSRFIANPSRHLRRLSLTLSPHFHPSSSTPPLSRFPPPPPQIPKFATTQFISRHFSTNGNGNNNNNNNGEKPTSDFWKIAPEDDNFGAVFGNVDGGDLREVPEAGNEGRESKRNEPLWGAPDSENNGDVDVFEMNNNKGFKERESGGSADDWLNPGEFKQWSLEEEEKTENVFDLGDVGRVSEEAELKEKADKIAELQKEEEALLAKLKGPNRAFGDLVAASGITDAMLDSLIALKNFNNIDGLPPLTEIEDQRYENSLKKSSRYEMEIQKQEEAAKARVRQVDDKDRAYGTGRRKCSTAKVWIQPGEGKFVVNEKEIDVYFPMLDHRAAVLRPFSETKTLGLWDVKCIVKGGGVSGQVGAVRLGISRALQNWEPGLRPPLREAGFLTRDPRAVERKKPGKAKARKSFQWVKR